MNAFIDKTIDGIIKAEGGYVDHPNDRGGPTMYGPVHGSQATASPSWIRGGYEVDVN